MNAASVMDAVAARLDTIAGLRVSACPPGTITPPGAVVGYPTSIDYDETYGRGFDALALPVVVVIGRASDRAAVTQFGAYTAGSGATSIKAVLESGTYTAFDSIRVTKAESDVYTLAGTDYIAAIFDCVIMGHGT